MPIDKWVDIGQTALFNCQATNANTLFWRKVGTDNLMFTGQGEHGRMHVLRNGTLVISRVTCADRYNAWQAAIIMNLSNTSSTVDGRNKIIRLSRNGLGNSLISNFHSPK